MFGEENWGTAASATAERGQGQGFIVTQNWNSQAVVPAAASIAALATRFGLTTDTSVVDWTTATATTLNNHLTQRWGAAGVYAPTGDTPTAAQQLENRISMVNAVTANHISAANRELGYHFSPESSFFPFAFGASDDLFAPTSATMTQTRWIQYSVSASARHMATAKIDGYQWETTSFAFWNSDQTGFTASSFVVLKDEPNHVWTAAPVKVVARGQLTISKPLAEMSSVTYYGDEIRSISFTAYFNEFGGGIDKTFTFIVKK
jgi:hypothetical protein